MLKENYFQKLIREAAEKRIQTRGRNLAAALYEAIGGTAYNQALAVRLGWQPQQKQRAFSERRPAGTKLARQAARGLCTVRHPSLVDAHFNVR